MKYPDRLKPGSRTGSVAVELFKATTPLWLFVVFNFVLSQDSTAQDLRSGGGAQSQTSAETPLQCSGNVSVVGSDVSNVFRAVLAKAEERGLQFSDLDLSTVRVTVKRGGNAFTAGYHAFTGENGNALSVQPDDELCIEW